MKLLSVTALVSVLWAIVQVYKSELQPKYIYVHGLFLGFGFCLCFLVAFIVWFTPYKSKPKHRPKESLKNPPKRIEDLEIDDPVLIDGEIKATYIHRTKSSSHAVFCQGRVVEVDEYRIIPIPKYVPGLVRGRKDTILQ